MLLLKYTYLYEMKHLLGSISYIYLATWARDMFCCYVYEPDLCDWVIEYSIHPTSCSAVSGCHANLNVGYKSPTGGRSATWFAGSAVATQSTIIYMTALWCWCGDCASPFGNILVLSVQLKDNTSYFMNWTPTVMNNWFYYLICYSMVVWPSIQCKDNVARKMIWYDGSKWWIGKELAGSIRDLFWNDLAKPGILFYHGSTALCWALTTFSVS
jgi:hypothetical protein